MPWTIRTTKFHFNFAFKARDILLTTNELMNILARHETKV